MIELVLLYELFEYYGQYQLKHDWTTVATGHESIFTELLTQMKVTANTAVYGTPHMTSNKQVGVQACLSDAESEQTTWSIAELPQVTDCPEGSICDITSNEQKQLKKGISINLI